MLFPLQLRMVSPEDFKALYQGPNDFFISGNKELIVKLGGKTAASWSS